jgi:uroporphyrinogen III methyltransferase/synthase
VAGVTVYLVGAGPGDPGLLTTRGAELLGRAEVVLHDRLVPAGVLALVPEGALVLDVGKRPGQPHRQEEINALLVEHGRSGKVVVRLKGGDPFVFGRGGEEAQALRAAGVPFEVVPGVTAALAVPAYAGVPVTHRGLASAVTVVTGRAGDAGGEAVDWEALARAQGTLVILMGMEHRADIAARLVAGGRPPGTPVVVVQDGTTAAQRLERTTLDRLHACGLGPPATIVVGEVAGLALEWFGAGPLAGTAVVVTRAAGRAGRLVTSLEAAGARVVAVPVVETADPDDGGEALRHAMARVGEFGWVVFSSAVAVGRALGALDDVRALAGVRLGVVGPATAEALAQWHLRPDVTAEPASAEGLAASMPLPGTRRRVLYPRAAEARPTLVAGLGARGWDVEDVVAYRTVPAGGSLSPAVLDAAAAADVVTFASPSAVRAYLEVAGGRRTPPLVVCIGPVTAEAARRAGLAVSVEAHDPSAEGLVEAVVAAVVTLGT